MNQLERSSTNEKIVMRHLEKLAVVYVRQSSLQQVLSNRESTMLQYNLVERAKDLGWQASRILVIDDDLGKSGSTSEGRAGFQRLVAEVGLDHVGLILGIEMSRLARSNKDWHHLLEVCALFGTLIADTNGVYDVSQYNDRLLLGLTGMMSEAELHLMKQRMHQGKLNKAKRGELNFPLPIGYVRRASGETTLDPDEQAQNVVRLIFRKFRELGTLHALLRYLVSHDIQLGVRVHSGPAKGELEWRRANRMTLQNMLKNPMYSGAYAYGRRRVDPRKKRPGRPSTGRSAHSLSNCHVLIKDHVPAYISWQDYEWNVARLKANQARADELGAARHGPALLGGLVICGKCGSRLIVSYGGQAQRHSYRCSKNATNYAGAICQHVAGKALTAFVSKLVLSALEPAMLELSLAAAAQLENDRAELDGLWQQRLERASFEAQRAARHYQLVEPENRLVARQLAVEWEQKLAAQQQLIEDHERFLAEQPRVLSAKERTAIRKLAQDLPALWHATGTTNAERKEIIRQVIERITVDAIGSSERVNVVVTWAGGACSTHEIIRPVAKLEQLSYYPELCQRVRCLAGEGLDAKRIAVQLNTEGFRPPKRREDFVAQGVRDLMRRLGLRSSRAPSKNFENLGEHKWTLPGLATVIGMPSMTLYNWVRRGWVKAQQQDSKRWIVWADEREIERLRERHKRPAGYYSRRLWLEPSAKSAVS
jgi:DNA invertase Pin-like site-specific DNA recombinase